jgi:hypothetical protein
MAGKSRFMRPGPVAAALCALSVVGMAALETRPRDRTQVAAVFSPWTSGERAFAQVAQAGGLVVRRGIIDAIVVVQGDDPALIDRLYAAGAWAVIDPSAWGGCLVGSNSTKHG